MGEPQRSHAFNAIDRAIKFWKGKRVPRCLPLRAPWLLSPTWSSDLRKLLKQHIAQIRPHTVTFQSPSSAVVFTKKKNPSVMDSLCNHKDYATRWADGEVPSCICSLLRPHQPTPAPVDFWTSPPRRRHLDTPLTLTHFHCHWIATEQDLSSQEGNMEGSAEIHPSLAPEKCHPVHTHSRLGRTLDLLMDTTFPAASQSHFSPRHHSIHPTLSRGRLPQ